MKQYNHAVYIPPPRRVLSRSGTVAIPLRRRVQPRDRMRATNADLRFLGVMVLLCLAALCRSIIER
jgi:nitrate reductase gamma subunit